MLERSAWYPEVRPGEEKDTKYCTKFGGNKPFRPDNFKWPVCEYGHHKAFVCQINIANLPQLLKEQIKMTSGLFQFFYCHECMPLRCFEDIYFIETSKLVPSLTSLAAEKVCRLKGYKKVLPPILRNFVQEYTEDIPLPTCDEYFLLDRDLEKKHTIEETVVKGWKIQSEMPSYEEFVSSTRAQEES